MVTFIWNYRPKVRMLTLTFTSILMNSTLNSHSKLLSLSRSQFLSISSQEGLMNIIVINKIK
jgi:hypothetical protein